MNIAAVMEAADAYADARAAASAAPVGSAVVAVLEVEAARLRDELEEAVKELTSAGWGED